MCLYQLMACWPTSYKLYMYNCTTMETLQFKKMPSIQTLKHWNWNSVGCSGVHVKTICYLSDNNPSAWKRKRNTCTRDGKTKTKRHSAVEIGINPDIYHLNVPKKELDRQLNQSYHLIKIHQRPKCGYTTKIYHHRNTYMLYITSLGVPLLYGCSTRQTVESALPWGSEPAKGHSALTN